MSEPVKRRAYTSTVRAEQAGATRRRVLDAAARRFLADGYAATTMAAVAREAGVSTDTVFHLFSSKRGVLTAALDQVIGGDDEDVAVLERSGPQAMREETDQGRQLAMFAAGIVIQLERIRPVDDMLRSAAAVDLEIAALRDDVQVRQRRQAMLAVAGWIAARGPLRGGMPVEDAAAVLWTMTSPEVHHMLRVTWDWPPDRYREWLHTSLVAALLPAQT